MLSTPICMRHNPAYLLIAPFPLREVITLPTLGGLAAGLPPLGLPAPAASSPSSSLLRCLGSSRLRSLRLLCSWRVWGTDQQMVQQHNCQLSQVLSRDAAVCRTGQQLCQFLEYLHAALTGHTELSMPWLLYLKSLTLSAKSLRGLFPVSVLTCRQM